MVHTALPQWVVYTLLLGVGVGAVNHTLTAPSPPPPPPTNKYHSSYYPLSPATAANYSEDYRVHDNGIITWSDGSFPVTSHTIEPADPCKAEAYLGDIALTRDEALRIKGAVFREDLHKKKKYYKPTTSSSSSTPAYNTHQAGKDRHSYTASTASPNVYSDTGSHYHTATNKKQKQNPSSREESSHQSISSLGTSDSSSDFDSSSDDETQLTKKRGRKRGSRQRQTEGSDSDTEAQEQNSETPQRPGGARGGGGGGGGHKGSVGRGNRKRDGRKHAKGQKGRKHRARLQEQKQRRQRRRRNQVHQQRNNRNRQIDVERKQKKRNRQDTRRLNKKRTSPPTSTPGGDLPVAADIHTGRERSVRGGGGVWRGRRKKRAATAKLNRIWEHAVIPYEIDANFSGSHKALFKQAMRHWENLTCISFVERSTEDKNYIVFTERPCGCCSFVGMRGNGPQAISIGKNCDKFGIVVHELGHVIGFWHEHTRPDRDNHVRIIYKNIIPGQDYNFNKLTANEVNSLGEPYDYLSIMHYARNTFSRIATLNTILPSVQFGNEEIEMGQRVKLSPGDIRQANKLYKCPSCGSTLQKNSGWFGSPSRTTPSPASPSPGEVVIIDTEESIDSEEHPGPGNGGAGGGGNVDLGESVDTYYPPPRVTPRTPYRGPDGSGRHDKLRWKNRLQIEDPLAYVYKKPGLSSGRPNIQNPQELELDPERMIQDSVAVPVAYTAEKTTDPPPSDSPVDPVLCEWRISGTHGEKIVLNITKLDVPQSHACMTDYVEVRDGHWVNSNLLGRFCRLEDVPGTLESSDSRMWIQYYSMTPGNHLGFLAHYEAVCGGEIRKDQGHLSSPNYPDYYRANKECVWRITVDENFRIAFMFQSFEIENHNRCVYDYLEIRDGPDESSPLIQRYCGYTLPSFVRSTHNKLYVKFKSDGSVQKAGFAASFIKEFDECATDLHGCHHICVNTMGSFRCQCNIGYELHSDGKRCEDACGGVIRSSNGTIQSPSFPAAYPPNKNCVWEIVAPDNYRITLNFTSFDLEGNNQDCSYDRIEILSDNNVHGTFCGNQPPDTITSDGNVMRIIFTTDTNIQHTGFSAYYFIDMDECAGEDNGGCQHICRNTAGSYECACHNGFTLHKNGHDCKEGGCEHNINSPSGEITSPGWPGFYPSRKTCVWRFTTTPGHRVQLEFQKFELEPHQECSYDRLDVFDSDEADASRKMDTYCGAREPDTITSTGNRLFLSFMSDASVQRQGFRAHHTSVCGGRLTATTVPQKLFSHSKHGDQNYDHKEQCDWLIVADDINYQIRFTFLSFEVEDEDDCSYDYVEVYDGGDFNAPRINRYCGNKVPPEISSSGPQLLISFKTDDTINWKGFSGLYSLNIADSPPTFRAQTDRQTDSNTNSVGQTTRRQTNNRRRSKYKRINGATRRQRHVVQRN